MVPRWLALAAIAASADAWAGNTQAFVGGGVGFSVGGSRNLGFFLDGAVSALPVPPGDVAPAVGMYSRLRWTRTSYATFALGFRGGVEAGHAIGSGDAYAPGVGLVAEGGWAWRTRGGHGPVIGVDAHALLFDLRYSTMYPTRRDEVPAVTTRPDGLPTLAPGIGPGPRGAADKTIDLAFTVPLVPVYWYIDGRPLRDGDRMIRPRIAARGGGRRFLDAAADEHAAVLAFLRLAAELEAVGAPARLVGRARAAAREEAGHAAAMVGLAARDGAGDVAIGPIAARLRGGSRRERLWRLFGESVVDGEINEGRAAVAAERDASAARDPIEAEARARIAREERGHAALARDVAGYCMREDAAIAGFARRLG